MVAADHFLDRLQALHRRYLDNDSVKPLAVAWVGINHFRSLRDRLGFRGIADLSEELLYRVGQSLAGNERCARLGESGVAILLGPERDTAALEAWAGELIEDLTGSRGPEVDGKPVLMTLNIGISQFDRRVRDAEQSLLDALHTAEALSHLGDSQYRIYQPRLPDSSFIGDDKLLVELLRDALSSNRLRVLYQPLLPTGRSERRHFQMWARLISDRGELIPATAFLQVAKQAGLLPRLERWTLAYAVRFLTAHGSITEQVRLFINQSPSLLSPKMRSWLEHWLKTHPEIAQALVMEFPFDDLLAMPRSDGLARLGELSELGLSAGVTGISQVSMDEVIAFRPPVRYLRMVPGFAERLLEDPELEREFGHFVDRAHDMGCLIIVPSIKDESAVIELWQSRIDFIQGDVVEHPRQSLEAFDG